MIVNKSKPNYKKKALKSSLILLVLFVLLMLTPRFIGFLFSNKAPIGYHFNALTYLAIGTGLEKLIDLKPAVPGNVEEIKNIEYKNVGGKSLQLDFYRPANTDEILPLLVFVHGGGWKGGQRSDYLPYLISYAQKGYMTATVSYRLKRDSVYPAAVEDVNDAVKWLFKNGEKYKYDANRIALIGGSAGAHLVLLAAYDWDRVNRPAIGSDSPYRKIKAVVDIYGPTDLTVPYARKQPLATGFIGHSYADRLDLYAAASPIRYADETAPRTLIFHGTSDDLVPVTQSDLLKAKLNSLGVECEYYRLPLWPHTMDIGLRVNRFTQKKMDAFFKKHLFQTSR